tara:strand:- start:385 stop:972 length:588 start_codon:yes stop_codon:yes gene_type:complete
MACLNCGSTNSSPCACQDAGFGTPCSFADCTGGSGGRSWPEFCADTYCVNCVTHCRNSFQISNAAGQYIYANAGEKLDTILQRMFIFATDPSCYNIAIPHLWHDETATTSTTVTLRWDSTPDTVNAIDVQFAPVNSAVWTTDNSVDLIPTTIEYTVGTNAGVGGPLTPNTTYKFRLVSNNGTCESVQLLVKTLNQ